MPDNVTVGDDVTPTNEPRGDELRIDDDNEPREPRRRLPFTSLNINGLVKLLHTLDGKNDDDGESFEAHDQVLKAACRPVAVLIQKESTTTSENADMSGFLAQALTLTCTGPAALIIRNVTDSTHGIEMYATLKGHFGTRTDLGNSGTIIARLGVIKLNGFASLGLFYAAFVRLINLLAPCFAPCVVPGELQRAWFLKAVRPGNSPPLFDPFYPVLTTIKEDDVVKLYMAMKDFAELHPAIIPNNNDAGRIFVAETRRDAHDNNNDNNNSIIVCNICGGMCHRANQCPSSLSSVAKTCVWCQTRNHPTEACRTKRPGWTIGTARYPPRDYNKEQQRRPQEGHYNNAQRRPYDGGRAHAYVFYGTDPASMFSAMSTGIGEPLRDTSASTLASIARVMGT
jgi:hypothetical protein